ncbi:PilZ domain-containing protein [Pseudodesulfovibrio pelocollis]|uniref:PilZ domain-containing protein n=1 Tax=Pseudodesulfovibrio pelocollis TaxID=3051432 RepID=UPI00255AE286|nr:PilZ domain-containing protein [Pseudodesulfovibrio sp. SB368]
MGFFDFFTSLFSRRAKPKARGGKKPASKAKQSSKPAAKSTAPRKGGEEAIGFNVAKTAEKKRKKAEKISAAPIDEKALGFSISLKTEDAQSKKREALRIRVDNLFVHVSRLNKRYPVTDISATGLGFAFEKPRIKAGVDLVMTIILDGKVMAKDVQCKVRRHDRGSVGCAFVDLDRAQDDAVHAIVLRGQKEQAARKTAQRDRDFKVPA